MDLPICAFLILPAALPGKIPGNTEDATRFQSSVKKRTRGNPMTNQKKKGEN